MRRLRVVSPGPRTTVEDLGRRNVARFGIPAGGAFDALALTAANRLVGNRDDAAGLEATLGGPTLANDGDEALELALVGADCGATLVQAAGTGVAPLGAAFACEPGETLQLGFARDGARAWIAVAGGLDVPLVVGGRGTCLAAGFGGQHGRALRRDDVLHVGCPYAPALPATWREAAHTAAPAPLVLRIVAGPQVEPFGVAALLLLRELPWRVQNASDRTGIRLAPPESADTSVLRTIAGIPPEGTTLGAIQLPPDGHPIILGPDRPVTGGYGKPALVIAADVGRLALLRPADVVRFALVSLDEALRFARERRETLPMSAPP